MSSRTSIEDYDSSEGIEDDFDPTASSGAVELEPDRDNDNEIALAEIAHSLARLLPNDQELLWFEATMSVAEALTTLHRSKFSQGPVRQNGHFIGVFSYRSFARAAATLGSTGPLADLAVIDCLETLPFATTEERIDEIFDDLDRYDAVLVGSRNDPRGIVTVMDALRYLFDISNAYVLMQQIELGLRHAIRMCVSAGELEGCVDLVLRQKYASRKREPPARLEDMELSDVVALITSTKTSSSFVSVLGSNVPHNKSMLQPLPQIRNELFHFKGALLLDDYERLATTRDWLFKKIEIADRARSTTGIS